MITKEDLKRENRVFFINPYYARIEECLLIDRVNSDSDDWTCKIMKTTNFRSRIDNTGGSMILHYSHMDGNFWHRTYDDALNALEADLRSVLERVTERGAL